MSRPAANVRISTLDIHVRSTGARRALVVAMYAALVVFGISEAFLHRMSAVTPFARANGTVYAIFWAGLFALLVSAVTAIVFGRDFLQVSLIDNRFLDERTAAGQSAALRTAFLTLAFACAFESLIWWLRLRSGSGLSTKYAMQEYLAGIFFEVNLILVFTVPMSVFAWQEALLAEKEPDIP